MTNKELANSRGLTNREKLEKAMMLMDLATALAREVRDDVARQRVVVEQIKQTEDGVDILARWFDE